MAVVEIEEDDVAVVGVVPVAIDVPGDGWGWQRLEGGAVEEDVLLQ